LTAAPVPDLGGDTTPSRRTWPLACASP